MRLLAEPTEPKFTAADREITVPASDHRGTPEITIGEVLDDLDRDQALVDVLQRFREDS